MGDGQDHWNAPGWKQAAEDYHRGRPGPPYDDPRRDAPPVESPDDFFADQVNGQAAAPRAAPIGPLEIGAWLERDLPSPDFLLGYWLSTTSRVLFNGPTGIGKSNLVLALGGHCAAGRDFLHWRAHRPARVLFIDGEMSRRLLKRRAEDLVRRLGTLPENLFLFSHEDMEGFQPLNTPAGAEFVDRIVRQLGSVDLIIFDNIMSLVAGDMREEEGWQRVLPLINSLTKQGVAQIWVHQTGHDLSHSYGTKTREWRMDTVLHLAEAARPDTDVSFRLEFRKARERTPETRNDFADAEIALVLDEWTSSAAAERRQQPSPTGQKFLEALRSVFATVEPIQFQTWNAVKSEDWRAECVTLGLLDLDKPHSARTLFGKYKRELIAANLIACNNELVWLR